MTDDIKYKLLSIYKDMSKLVLYIRDSQTRRYIKKDKLQSIRHRVVLGSYQDAFRSLSNLYIDLRAEDLYYRRNAKVDEVNALLNSIEMKLDEVKGFYLYNGGTKTGSGQPSGGSKSFPLGGGEVIEGFESIKILGVSNAIVYLAFWRDKGKNVALKMPYSAPGISIAQNVLDEFTQEAEIWSELESPYIVKLYATGKEPKPWLAMEYVKYDFRKLMKKNIDEKIDFFLKTLEALSYAHAQHVVHRDIKPENILIDENGDPKISDWGLARIMSKSIERTKTFRGSLNFAAPEQFIGEYDFYTDIYQVAAVMYYAFTGEFVFGGGSEQEIMKKIINDEPKSMKEINPKIPEALDRIVMIGLSKKKTDRWNSMAEFKRELKKYIDGNREKKMEIYLNFITADKRIYKKLREGESVDIGRCDSSHICLKYSDHEERLEISDKHASEVHAKIFWVSGMPYIKDLGSRYGTKIDGMTIPGWKKNKESDPVPLISGSKILIGKKIYISIERTKNALTLREGDSVKLTDEEVKKLKQLSDVKLEEKKGEHLVGEVKKEVNVRTDNKVSIGIESSQYSRLLSNFENLVLKLRLDLEENKKFSEVTIKWKALERYDKDLSSFAAEFFGEMRSLMEECKNTGRINERYRNALIEQLDGIIAITEEEVKNWNLKG